MSNFSSTSFKLFAIQIRSRGAEILKVSLPEQPQHPSETPMLKQQLEPPASAPAPRAAAPWGPCHGDRDMGTAPWGLRRVCGIALFISSSVFCLRDLSRAVLPKSKLVERCEVVILVPVRISCCICILLFNKQQSLYITFFWWIPKRFGNLHERQVAI